MIMIRKVKNKLKQTLAKNRKANTNKKRSATGRMAIRNRYADAKRLIGHESPVIIDGGAYNGSTINQLSDLFKKPRIISFEPNPGLYASLQENFGHRDNVTIIGKAIGSESGKGSFNVLKFSPSSSLLEPSSINRAYHDSKMDIEEKVDIEITRLDDHFKSTDEIDLLKLDLQGYELEALKGAERILENVKVISTEIEFVPLYEGQPLFGDIDVYLRSKGFRLLNLYDLFTQQNGQLTAGDAMYINTRYYKDFDTVIA
jgi:FkbM family methyltransferase